MSERWQPSPRSVQRMRWALIALASLPLGRLVAGAVLGTLGANPIETVTHSTGTWTLVMLAVTLAVTPLRRLGGWPWLLRLRRTLGLLTFAWACLHALTYFWFDRFFDWADIVRDIGKRPFITAGFAAFVLLVPLAATSTNAAIRWLGGRRWQRLHYAVYAVAVLGVAHFVWLVKKDLREPLIYAAVFALLFALRIAGWLQEARRRARDAKSASPLAMRRKAF